MKRNVKGYEWLITGDYHFRKELLVIMERGKFFSKDRLDWLVDIDFDFEEFDRYKFLRGGLR